MPAVATGRDGVIHGFGAGKILVDMSASPPGQTREVAKAFGRAGIAMLDAPPLGGLAELRAGKLVLLVGGEDEVVERCRPVLETIAPRLIRTGAVGTGHAAKALAGQLAALCFLATAETLFVGRRAGLEPAALLEALNASAGANHATQETTARHVLSREFGSGLGLDALLGDLDRTLEIARVAGSHAARAYPGDDRGPTAGCVPAQHVRHAKAATAIALYRAATGRALTSGGNHGAPPMMRRLFGLGREPRTFEFKCVECGTIHRGSPSYGFGRPPLYHAVPEAEREARIRFTQDTCVIAPAADDEGGQTHYFLRGVLEVPIIGAEEPFVWGVWVTQSKDSFMKYLETFDDDQSGISTFGWLSVTWAPYSRTRPGEYLENLPCTVHWQREGKRPVIEVQACDHPLHVDQRDGISWDRAIEIARTVMHGGPQGT